MMSPATPVDFTDLHALADGRLADDRRAAVEALLAHDPAAAAQAAAYRAQNEALHALFDPVLAEPIPPAMLVRRRPWAGSLVRIAAALALMVVGAGTGWFAHDTMRTASGVEQSVAEPAAYAHRAFVGDFRNPVEIWGDNQPHLVAWLSNRLGIAVEPPNLDEVGYWLVGGRMLPASRGAAAQLMYQNDLGGRITLYVRTGVTSNTESRFQDFDRNGVRMIYWVDGPVGYAMTGSADRDLLLKAAQIAYGQTQR